MFASVLGEAVVGRRGHLEVGDRELAKSGHRDVAHPDEQPTREGQIEEEAGGRLAAGGVKLDEEVSHVLLP
eukprot:14696475-Alexandrium_andersonii.AAC.1